MKLFLQPSRSTAHRIACIALYRAILEQCPRVQHLAEGWPAMPLTFKHLVRKQFRRNQHVQHSRLVVVALQAGYEAEALLRHAGDGDVTALSKVMAVLCEIESTRALSRANAAPPLAGHQKRRLPAPYPGAKSIFETRPRPLSELGGSGIRRAPVFVNARLSPMLRFSKRHNPFLSRVLRQIEVRKNATIERIEGMEEVLNIGRGEDQWDWLVQRAWIKEGRGGGERDRGSWCDFVREQMAKDKRAFDEIIEKKKEKAKKMLELLSQEEELVARERVARRRARRRERKLREHDSEDQKLRTL